jgi:malonyl-CoA/methylmalonyl-CoA synthetase
MYCIFNWSLQTLLLHYFFFSITCQCEFLKMVVKLKLNYATLLPIGISKPKYSTKLGRNLLRPYFPASNTHLIGLTRYALRNVIHPCLNGTWSSIAAFGSAAYSTATTPTIPLFARSIDFLERTAVVDQFGTHTYAQLLHHSIKLHEILKLHLQCRADVYKTSQDPSNVTDPRVALLAPNDASYVIAMWAASLAGAVLVPLHSQYPASVLDYYVVDSGASLILAAPSLEPLANELVSICSSLNPVSLVSLPSLKLNEGESVKDVIESLSFIDSFQKRINQGAYEQKHAMIVYTSGSTGPPKGVVLTYGNIEAQIKNMTSSWAWHADDVILHVLPLHHVHGIVNCLFTPLYVGALVHFLPKFDAASVLNNLTSLDVAASKHHSLFMAVPTIYAKLIEYIESNLGDKPEELQRIKQALSSNVRLMVSGSAALPTPVSEKWEQLSGHKLLERYGMTEVGMALSNPLEGERIPGAVGSPMPSVRVAIAKEELGYSLIAECHGQAPNSILYYPESEATQLGELLVKGKGSNLSSKQI